MGHDASRDKMLSVCLKALSWAKDRDYTGYNKHDGLNSPVLCALSLNNKWLRIFCIQAVMRSPFNFRPLLGVRKARNHKGIALFARAYLNLYRLTGDDAFKREAIGLLDWLIEHPAQGFRGLSWGYGYPWQDLGFYAPAWFPNRIVTYFVGRAFIHAYEMTWDKKYLDAAERAVDFILGEPRVLVETDTVKCVSYVPLPDITVAIMDVPALCGALCAMVSKHTGRSDLLPEARKLVGYVVERQTEYGAWFYADPPDDSHITHDNYHTGEIIDAIRDYQTYSGDARFKEAYRVGLDYYRANLFTPNGNPRWMNDKEYPYDIHGYSQGIITFASSGEIDVAEKIAHSALRRMWNDKDGRFYYQKHRLYVVKLTLMRWCQAWMAYALSHLLVSRERNEVS